MELNDNNTSIKLFVYPTYKLYGRIRKEDVNKYKETLDDSLIIYKYCINERSFDIPDYKRLWSLEHRQSSKDYYKKRLAQGYKTV